LLRLAPASRKKADRESIPRAIRTRFEKEAAGLALRVCDLGAANCSPLQGYPIELAFHGRKAEPMREWAEKTIERLRQSGKLTDVWLSPGSRPIPQLYLDVNREAAAREGIRMVDLLDTLQLYSSSMRIEPLDGGRFGRVIQISLQGEALTGKTRQGVKNLKIRNANGQMIPLTRLVTVRDVTKPQIIEDFNGEPMARLTSNPAPGTSLAEARALCERVAEAVRKELQLPAEYGLTWLQ
jgi:multidrug efflux pump subunit AcrB